EVDVVGVQPPQARLATADHVVPGQARVVGPRTHRHAHLGGDQHAIAVLAERLPEALLGQPGRVDVGGVDEVDAGLAGQVDLGAGAVDVDGADGLGPAGASEAHGAGGDGRDAQAGPAELP